MSADPNCHACNGRGCDGMACARCGLPDERSKSDSAEVGELKARIDRLLNTLWLVLDEARCPARTEETLRRIRSIIRVQHPELRRR